MLESELRRKARQTEATALASKLELNPDELRRWINGGINATVRTAVAAHFAPVAQEQP